MVNNLCIGTAQFGFDYGITNTKGKLDFNEVQEILGFAADCGINYIDTAQDYGSAEKIIGGCISTKKNINLISKLKSHKRQSFTKNDVKEIQNNGKIPMYKLCTCFVIYHSI